MAWSEKAVDVALDKWYRDEDWRAIYKEPAAFHQIREEMCAALDAAAAIDGDQAAYWKGVAERALAKQCDYEAALKLANEELTKMIATCDGLAKATKPFAALGVGSGPDYETETYQIERGAIRQARMAHENAAAATIDGNAQWNAAIEAAHLGAFKQGAGSAVLAAIRALKRG